MREPSPQCQCGGRTDWTGTDYRQFYCHDCERYGQVIDGTAREPEIGQGDGSSEMSDVEQMFEREREKIAERARDKTLLQVIQERNRYRTALQNILSFQPGDSQGWNVEQCMRDIAAGALQLK